jgi:hypothetical protein
MFKKTILALLFSAFFILVVHLCRGPHDPEKQTGTKKDSIQNFSNDNIVKGK